MSKIIAVIPARKGSKGLPGKNTLPIKNTPLISHSIALAKCVGLFSEIVVTTDCKDSTEIAKTISGISAIKRPSALAQDDSSIIDVLLHAAESLHSKNDLGSLAIALLQPTSPFRSVKDIDNAVSKYRLQPQSPLVSVSRSSQHYFEIVLRSPDGQWHQPSGHPSLKGRQSYQLESYFISGSFYIAPYCYLKSHRTFLSADTVFQVFDEPHVIDIDTPSDYELACSIASLPSMREYVYPFVNGEN